MKQSYLSSLLYSDALLVVDAQDIYSAESAHEDSRVSIFDVGALSGEFLQADWEFMHTKCNDVEACDKTMESDLLALCMQIEDTVDARLFDQQITEAGFAAGVCIHAVYDGVVFVPPNLYAPMFTPLSTSMSQPYYEDLFRETHARPISLSTEVYLWREREREREGEGEWRQRPTLMLFAASHKSAMLARVCGECVHGITS